MFRHVAVIVTLVVGILVRFTAAQAIACDEEICVAIVVGGNVVCWGEGAALGEVEGPFVAVVPGVFALHANGSIFQLNRELTSACLIDDVLFGPFVSIDPFRDGLGVCA